jgi:PEP-CTERM motif
MVPVGDPVSDYGANVLANDYENYTYEHATASGSGRGGGYKPPKYIRGPAATYSDTYTHLTHPPTDLHAFFHFSGTDVAGVPLTMNVLNDGAYSLALTADADPTHTPITPGTPLSSALYTLEFETTSLAGSQVTFTFAPLPGDFNGDGVVDVADFGVWRKGLGTIYTQADYDLWRANFGQTRATAAGASLGVSGVPEPAAIVLLLFAFAAFGFIRTARR